MGSRLGGISKYVQGLWLVVPSHTVRGWGGFMEGSYGVLQAGDIPLWEEPGGVALVLIWLLAYAPQVVENPQNWLDRAGGMWGEGVEMGPRTGRDPDWGQGKPWSTSFSTWLSDWISTDRQEWRMRIQLVISPHPVYKAHPHVWSNLFLLTVLWSPLNYQPFHRWENWSFFP